MLCFASKPSSFTFTRQHTVAVVVPLNPRRRPAIASVRTMSSWSCEQCTFLNPPSQKSTCLICLSPFPSPPSLISSSSSSSSVPKWSCKACTFLNPYDKPNCEICDSRAPISSLSAFEDLNDVEIESDAAGFGSVFFPLRACKRARVSEPEPASESASSLGFRSILNKKESDDSAVTELEDASSGKSLNTHTIKVLSYNVWFREDLELHKRMKALGDIIELHSPHIICFQEVTPNIYAIFQKSNWWKVYNCSVSEEIGFSSSYFCMQLSRVPVKTFSCRPFPNSGMGRELCISEIEISEKKSMTVATSHLESPCPGPPTWDQMFSKERVAQAKEALDFLRKKRNVIFAGDMNWDDKLDGRFPFPDDDWIDAWLELRPGENGWTYDTKSNKMLSGNRTLQKRLDRFVCKLADFEISQIEMVGLEPIPCVSYIKEKKVKNEIKKLELPVLPSDHFGLLLTICSR